MRIQDLLSEAAPGTMSIGNTIKTGMGFNAGAGTGSVLKTMALKGLGLGNTANAYAQQKGVIGGDTDISKQTPQQIAQTLALKPGSTVDLGNGQKGQIKAIDQTGVKFADGTIWGTEKLATLAQQRQALQTLSQQGQQKVQ